MKRVRLTEMKASVFALTEAKQRSGEQEVTGSAGSSPIKRGGSDRGNWVTTTTQLKTQLPGHIPVSTVMELGIPKQSLRKLIKRAEQKKNKGKPVSFTGEYRVNEVPCFGTLTVDFGAKNAPSFVYAEKSAVKRAAAEAA